MDFKQFMENDKFSLMLEQSLVSEGNNYRMKKAIEKAHNNEKVTLIYVGASITEQRNREMDSCYASLSYEYFKDSFGRSDNIRYINAGITGTTSTLGLVRLENDVLQYSPDIVFVEFAVNDMKDEVSREVFESMVISLLMAESQPAVILLFMCSESRYSCQGHMQVIGEHYRLPMISIKDALLAGINLNLLKWADYADDNLHPNKNGHYLIAELIANYFKKVRVAETDEEFILPEKPFYGNSFTDITVLDSRNAKITSTGSFFAQKAETLYEFKYGWNHFNNSGNDSLVMKLNCKNLFAVYKESNSSTVGNAEVYVDGQLKCKLNGYQMFAWNNPTCKLVFSEATSIEHTIEIKMVAGDEKKEFDLMAFGYSRKQMNGKEHLMSSCNIELSPLISDGMVLQRDSKVRIWGIAAPKEKLNLEFIECNYQTQTDEQGKWEVILEGLSAGGPFEMQIDCKDDQRIIHNIMVGDIWVLGGQSNMQIPIGRTLDLFEDEVKNANCPYIRQFTVPEIYNFHGPCDELTGGSWLAVTPGTVNNFSGVGYFYAKKLYEKYHVPIGLIFTAIGGTPSEAWISEKTLMRFGRFQEDLLLCKDDTYVQEKKQRDETQNIIWYSTLYEKDAGLHGETPWYSTDYNDSDWKTMEVPNSFKDTELEYLKGAVWFRKEIDVPESLLNGKAKLILGTIVDADDTYINGIAIGTTGYLYPPRRYEIPEGVLKKGKNVIAVRVMITSNVGAFVTDMPYFLKANGKKLPISGTWKYCIGAILNAMSPTTFFQYKPTGVYNAMIYPLRKYCIRGALWYQGESNTGYPYDYKKLQEAVIKDWRNTWNIGDFPFLYVQLPKYCPWRMEPEESGWAIVRDQQRRAMDIKNTGMAVSLDVGEYNDLHPQDKKTVGERLALWAEKMLYDEDIVYSGPLYNHMEIEGSRIKLYFDYIGSGLTAKEGELKTFEICGKDNKFVEAESVIEGNTVCVSSVLVDDPVYARYAWADCPEEANLYNKEGLPAAPFTTQN